MGAANLVSVKSARRHQAVPVGFVDEQTLLLAMADPANVLALDDVQMATGYNCQVAVAPPADIESLIWKLTTLQSTVAEAIAEDEEEQEDEPERDHRHPRLRRRRAGDQARQQHPRPGRHRGRVGHPLRGERGRDADQVPHRRRPPGGRPRPEADGRRRRLAHQDHERARHRREAHPAGRPRRRHDRGPPRRPSRHHPADPARGGGHRPHPRRGQPRAAPSTTSGCRATSATASRPRSASPTARSSSPARPARASRPRSTRRSRS